jgi:hypothetical protein
MSPVRAKVITTSSAEEKLAASPLTYETGTLKYPVVSVIVPVIAKNAKSFASCLLATRRCPFIGEVLSSIVRKKA